jgi:hypothetical protein
MEKEAHWCLEIMHLRQLSRYSALKTQTSSPVLHNK